MSKKYLFIRDGKKEHVELERWAWEVTFKNGQVFKQFGDDGMFHQMGEINQEKVKTFILYNTDTGKSIHIIVPKGARLIHKYKRYVLHFGTPAEIKETIYVFGYKLGKHYHYNYILTDDSMIQSTDDEVENKLNQLV